jgi:GT2 family glycosyltransferase
MMTILFVLVHYRNTDAIRAAIRNIRALYLPHGWNLDVAVADNSGDAPANLDACIVAAEGNRGYLGGAALALERWRELHGRSPNWSVITNPDAELRQNALVALAGAPLADDVAIVAPSVLLAGTTPQNPFLANRPSRARMRFYTIAFRSRVLTRMLDASLELKRRVARARVIVGKQPRAIYAAHGSIVFIRALFFERGGTLDYRGFMYGEEIHLAEQVRALGLRVVFAPAVEVVHHGGSTTGRIDAARRREWHRASADVLWEEYFR